DGLFLGALRGDVQFELDGETTPRLSLDREALFSGTRAPFLSPLAGDRSVSSGGFYSVVPIPFARRLRISTSTVPNWMQATFSHPPPAQRVTSSAPPGATSGVAALRARAGAPATTAEPTGTADVAVSVEAGAEAVLWEHAGPGTIVRL